MDRSHRPHRHPTQHTSWEVARVLKVQRHNKRLGLVCLWVQLKMNYGYTRSLTALYKLLRREGIMPGPRKRPRRKPKLYEPILERIQQEAADGSRLAVRTPNARKLPASTVTHH